MLEYLAWVGGGSIDGESLVVGGHHGIWGFCWFLLEVWQSVRERGIFVLRWFITTAAAALSHWGHTVRLVLIDGAQEM